jgi:hypothetical protein
MASICVILDDKQIEAKLYFTVILLAMHVGLPSLPLDKKLLFNSKNKPYFGD